MMLIPLDGSKTAEKVLPYARALMEGQRYAGVLMVIPSTTVERSPVWIS